MGHKLKHENEGFSLIPEGMDTFSTILVVLILISVGVQLLYIISPKKVKQFIEYLDYDYSENQ